MEMAAGQPLQGVVPSTTVDIGPQVLPSSLERRRTRAWWGPLSPQSVTRFSEKARRVPFEVLIMDGMRKHFELFSPA